MKLAQPLLKEEFLSEKLNQHPQYFSKQRDAEGSSDNPTVEQFIHNVFALHVASLSLLALKKDNSTETGAKNHVEINSTLLLKREIWN